jgi:predicted ATPase/class 3 adenylate cyclase
VSVPSTIITLLFTDIEGSTRLWEQAPERMRTALAAHDALARAAVERHRGTVVKATGDGIHAAFAAPRDAIAATLALQRALADAANTAEVPLRVRCGLHLGLVEQRDNDYFGTMVNRAARIMAAAHGGQVLVSEALALALARQLPDDVTLRDLGAVRLKDLARAERVFQLVHPALRHDFPALRSLESTPNNLPQQATSFIGREQELADVVALLRRERLLTLTGAGGLGKTRLSLQAAAEMLDEFEDGVWQVELAAIADAQRVPQAVASMLGVKEDGTGSITDALARYVADRELLLILDNCEHLLDACASIATLLLRAGPRIKVLTSSREALHVAGETTYAVPPLAIPGPEERVPLAALSQYAAVNLFVERAAAVQTGFRLDERNAEAVAAICRRLDGIPLALELAAARVRTLPVERIAERLSDRFRLLTNGYRTALPRQQTLRALIDWSYELLTDAERRLLQRLAVFAGGFTLEAAEAVGASEALAAADVLDVLSRLVEKSLVTLDADRARYRMLDTVREYAGGKLDEVGETPQAREQHLAFYVALADRARPEFDGPAQGSWLVRFDAELENLLAAHAWCGVAETRAVDGLLLATSIKPYWVSRGLLGLGLQVTLEALGRSGASARNLARCRALGDAGMLACFMGKYPDAQRTLDESVAIARALGEAKWTLSALQPLAYAHFGQGDLAMARAHLSEAIEIARALDDQRELLVALNGLAQVHRGEGHIDRAEPLYVEVVALARALGDRESVAIGLLNLAMVSIGRDNLESARTELLEILDVAEQTGSKQVGQSALDVAAGLLAATCAWPQSARLHGAAEAQLQQTGFQRDPADEAFLAPWIDRARAALGESAFAAAADTGRALGYAAALSEARRALDRA